VRAIDTVEDRSRFTQLLSRLSLRRPKNRIAVSRAEIPAAAEEVGYPVLIRHSYVLGGRSIMIAYGPEELERFLTGTVEVSIERPVLIDEFLEDAFEYDVDALCDGHNVYIGGIMQHIEAAGIHSGDSACVFPPDKSDPGRETQMRDAYRRLHGRSVWWDSSTYSSRSAITFCT